MGSMVKPSEFKEHVPTATLHLLWSSLIRGNAVFLDKTFSKLLFGNLGRKSEFIFRVSIPVRTKYCPFHDGSSPV